MKQIGKILPLLCLTIMLSVGSTVFAEDGLLSDSELDNSSNNKRFSVRISPLGLILAAINVEVDIAITDNLTIGPMITYWGFTLDNDDFTFDGYGARANWYFSKAMEGAYVSPFFKRYSLSLTNSFGETGSASFSMFGGLLGYQYLWDSINMNVEVGYGVLGSEFDFVVTNSSGNVIRQESAPTGVGGGLVLDWTVGFSF